MWQLVDAVTNRVTYRNLWDQWEACKTSFHKDGTKIKKAEAMALESGATVYRKYNVKKFFKVPVITGGRNSSGVHLTSCMRHLTVVGMG